MGIRHQPRSKLPRKPTGTERLFQFRIGLGVELAKEWNQVHAAPEPVRIIGLSQLCCADVLGSRLNASIFVLWTRKSGEVRILNRGEFTRRLEARGFQKRRSGHARTWTWFGLCLRTEHDWFTPGNSEPPPPPEPKNPIAGVDERADADIKLQ
jgi:hypothetical protein